MPLSELDEAFFEVDTITNSDTTTTTDDTTTATTDTTTDDTATTDTTTIVATADTTTATTADDYTPPYKGKKFIEVADEAALYEQLDRKYGHTKISSDAKALAYLKQQNPELDEQDLAFMAATEYGIGVDKPKEEDLNDQQIVALRKQDIARKKLTSQADSYFKQQAEQVALQETDPLELDQEYKTYREQAATQKAEAAKAQEHINNINKNFETAAVKIPEIVENIEIDIDESKFAVPVSFKMNAKKQEQLADFAKRYQPSKAEFDAFNDPETGKFDYDGYLKSLIPMVFGKELSKAATRQALSQDRDNFISGQLKNSNLKDGAITKAAPVDKEFDLAENWNFG